MNAPAIKISKPVREQVGRQEWEVRVNLAACSTKALSCNTELRLPPNEVVQYTNHQMLPGTRRRFGLLEWPALLRKLDRIDPSYRD